MKNEHFNRDARKGSTCKENTRKGPVCKAENTRQSEMVSPSKLLEKINPIIENTLMRYDLIPLEVEFVKESHRWFLRIFIYSYSRPITIDDCERVTRSLSDFLDELIPFKYHLEVSSPGLERKLKSDKEYLIFAGKNIDIKLKNPVDESGEKHFKAKLLDFDEKLGVKILKLDTNEEYAIKKDEIITTRLCID